MKIISRTRTLIIQYVSKIRKSSEYLQVTNRGIKEQRFSMFSMYLQFNPLLLKVQKIASYFISKNLKRLLSVRTAGAHYKNNLTNGITLKSVTNGIIVSSWDHAGERIRNSNVISALTVRTALNIAKRILFVDIKKFKQMSRGLLLGIGLSQLRVGCWRLNTATLIAALPLAGCIGIYEGGFECPAGTGVGCKSISDVNEMVNLGEIPKAPSVQSSEEAKPAKLEIWYAPAFRHQMQEIGNQKDSLRDSEQIPFPQKEQRKGAELTDV